MNRQWQACRSCGSLIRMASERCPACGGEPAATPQARAVIDEGPHRPLKPPAHYRRLTRGYVTATVVFAAAAVLVSRHTFLAAFILTAVFATIAVLHLGRCLFRTVDQTRPDAWTWLWWLLPIILMIGLVFLASPAAYMVDGGEFPAYRTAWCTNGPTLRPCGEVAGATGSGPAAPSPAQCELGGPSAPTRSPNGEVWESSSPTPTHAWTRVVLGCPNPTAAWYGAGLVVAALVLAELAGRARTRHIAASTTGWDAVFEDLSPQSAESKVVSRARARSFTAYSPDEAGRSPDTGPRRLEAPGRKWERW